MILVDSAPKIGDTFYDPLIFDSSNSYISDENIIPNLRKGISPEETELQYEGYIFDGNKCKTVNTRILCGYNKNKGTLTNDVFIDMGNGCRSRGDRIECGYENKPYNKHLRGPSENGKQIEQNKVVTKPEAIARQAPTRTSTSEIITPLLKMKNDFHQNNLLKSALSTILVKQVNKTSVTMAELTEPITSSPAPSSPSPLPIKTEFTVANEMPTTLITIMESKTIRKLAQPSDKTKIESTSPSSTTEMISSTTENTENVLSHWDTMKRTIRLENNYDHEKTPVKRRRRLAKILFTSSELYTKLTTATANTDSRINNCETTSSNIDTQIKRNRDEKINIACVEKDGRVVCYNYKT